ncbi:transposase [bacterium]|nr:transposase [bacterium]
MKTSKFTDKQRLAIVAKHDSGQSVDDICRAHQISPATFYKWKREAGIDQDDEKRRLKQLEQENARLKKMYSELSIHHEILQEGYDMVKKMLAQPKKKI